MKDTFAIYFTRKNGLVGVDTPRTEDVEELSENYALLGGLRPALKDFEKKLREVATQK